MAAREPSFILNYICEVRNCLLFLLGISLSSALAQDKNPEQDSVQIFRSDYNLRFKPYNYTNLNQFQTYRTDFGSIPHARSGNLGLPIHYYDSLSIETGINSMFSVYSPYILTKEKLSFYKTKKPFTSLDYVNGSEKEQYFSAFHTQNFGDGMNFSFQYDRITSEGFFANQLTNHTRFNTNYHLQSRNGRFKSQSYFIINTIEAQENGGVFESDEPNQEANTVLLDIGLRGAQNRSRSQSIGTKNSYAILNPTDSNNFPFALRLGHELEWNKAFRNYADLQSGLNGFYQNSFIDTTASFDTTYASELSNKVFLDFFDGRILFHARDAEYRYFQNFILQEEISSQYIGAHLSDSIRKFYLLADLEKGISGYHRDEFYLDASLSTQFNPNNRIEVLLGLESRRPNPLMDRIRLNRFYYNHNTKLLNHSSLAILLNNTKWDIQAKLSIDNYENLIYYGSDRELNQLEKNVQWLRLNLRKFWNLGKHYKMINQINFQQISQDSVLPLPAISSFNSLFYDNIFFKESLHFQLGLDLYFISSYAGYAYDPAQASFHLRQDGQKKLGNISQVDIFMNIRIAQSARLFFKAENVLQSPYDPESERIEDYPIPGRALKIGLSWRMIN